MGRYHAVGGQRQRGPHLRQMARSRLYCLITDTIQSLLARFLRSPAGYSAVGGHAHMPAKTAALRNTPREVKGGTLLG